ncbi:ATP-binding protein [Streptomyces sp. NPDC007162]|uniref:ATP-binding protein n=1 Tax=Streptomyces sp. NPDC007162 TaxID=3156917 RepID=UPI0033E1A061
MVETLTRPEASEGVRALARVSAGHLDMTLDVTPRSVGLARRIVGANLDLWGFGRLCDVAELVVTELLTNVLRHTAPAHDGAREAQITLTKIPGGVTLCIHDDDPNEPRQVQASPDSEHGRGIQLVKALAEVFGSALSPGGGKDVWVTLLVPHTPS